MSLGELRGKTAVITGASRGLGAGLAEDFHARGIRLGLCSRGEPALRAGDAVLAERVDVRDAEALESYGMNFGIAFQLVDDVLDYSAEQAKLGKTVGDDFREGKITLPVIIARRRGRAEDQAFWARAFDLSKQEEGDLARPIPLIRTTGAAEATIAEAEAYVGLAKSALSRLPDTQWRHLLAELADFCIRRVS